ncbi:transmembrane protein 70, mitochondrial isoform X2 [Conger conger]|uniref:transmembrane protein 70, mitochondrial isoform X2 n=1 Tax=Conger conger TaxID=82655 RepID=UPI002A598A2E|nr:transmembrane protein 70, mitochondrial isoform X2 [Conger conger]
MFCLYITRGVQSTLKSRPILTQSRHIGKVICPVSKIHRTNASPVSGTKSSYACVLLKYQGSLLQVTRRPFFNNVSINKVQSSPVHKALRCFCSSSSSNSEEGTLIYSGSLAKAVLGVKLFSYSTSIFSMCVMPQVLLKTGFGVQSLALQVAVCGTIGLFTFITPVLLHLLSKGYVVRLYHNHEMDTYTAVTYNALLAEKKTVFHQSQVSVPGVSKMFTTFYANRRSMLVNPELFALPHDYNHLMGYDKPFSFDLDKFEEQERSKQD